MATLNTLDKKIFEDLGKPIVVASHPRSGTHLTIDLLRKQFIECQSWKKRGEPLDRLYFALESFAPKNNPLPESLALNILARAKRPIIKTHADPNFSYLLDQKKNWIDWLHQTADIYYVYRDGRSVLCSLHLFMQSYDPSARCSFSEFIRQEVDGCSRAKNWANHIKAWINQPNITALCFEDIIHDTELTIQKIREISKLSYISKHPLLPLKVSSIWYGRWARFAKKKSESTAILGYYLNQKVKRWQESFSLEDCQFFDREAGETLINLGYESSNNWVEKTSIIRQ